MFLKGEPSDIQHMRIDMPQIKSKNFADFVSWAGIICSVREVNGNTLKPTQIDINEEKVAVMKQRVLDKDPTFKGTITISMDGYVLDGHHRWLAFINADVFMIKCNVLPLTALDALELMRNYPQVIKHDLNDKEVI